MLQVLNIYDDLLAEGNKPDLWSRGMVVMEFAGSLASYNADQWDVGAFFYPPFVGSFKNIQTLSTASRQGRSCCSCQAIDHDMYEASIEKELALLGHYVFVMFIYSFHPVSNTWLDEMTGIVFVIYIYSLGFEMTDQYPPESAPTARLAPTKTRPIGAYYPLPLGMLWIKVCTAGTPSLGRTQEAPVSGKEGPFEETQRSLAQGHPGVDQQKVNRLPGRSSSSRVFFAGFDPQMTRAHDVQYETLKLRLRADLTAFGWLFCFDSGISHPQVRWAETFLAPTPTTEPQEVGQEP